MDTLAGLPPTHHTMIFLPLSFCLIAFSNRKMSTERERQKDEHDEILANCQTSQRPCPLPARCVTLFGQGFVELLDEELVLGEHLISVGVQEFIAKMRWQVSPDVDCEFLLSRRLFGRFAL